MRGVEQKSEADAEKCSCRRRLSLGLVTRDEATNSTIKERVPLAGKGASLDEIRALGGG